MSAYQAERPEHATGTERWPLTIASVTLGIWALHVLLVYGRVGVNGSVPLYLIWPRVGSITLVSLCLCLPFLLVLQRVRTSSPAGIAIAVVAISITGGLLGGGTVALYAIVTNDTAPYSIASQFASAAMYWMWIYFGWSLAVVLLLKRSAARQNVGNCRPTRPDPEVEFWIRRSRHRDRVRSSEVFWFEAAGDYVLLHTADRQHMLHESLSALTARLDPKKFMRVHRSAIVNLETIDGVKRNPAGDYLLRLHDGSSVRVGRSYKRGLRSALQLLAQP